MASDGHFRQFEFISYARTQIMMEKYNPIFQKIKSTLKNIQEVHGGVYLKHI